VAPHDSNTFGGAVTETGLLDPRDRRTETRAALRAWLALQQRLAYEPARAREALARHGTPAAVLRARFDVAPEDLLGDRAFTAMLDALARRDVRLLPLGAPAYPARIAALPDAAPLLAVRGDPARLAEPLVAIVGARAPTRLGLDIGFALARGLAEHGVGVVSGLARGIDAAAHRGALDARGTTIAVLGCGADRIYPPEHADLAASIAARGAVVSELPVGAPPVRHHFPARNRLISALARAVVVVEARARSGSLVTARHAADQGREVLAVPGSVGAPTSEGPNQLLRAGAWPVLDVSDVLAAIGLGAATPRERAAQRERPAAAIAALASPARPDRRAAGASTARDPHVSASDSPLLVAIASEPATRDALCQRLGWSAQRLARELFALEIEGRVVEDRDGRLRVARSS
jgi:DNA processing protein